MANRATMKDAFLCGYASALADILRLHGSEVEVHDAMEQAGLSIADLRAAGVDLQDLGEILKTVKL